MGFKPRKEAQKHSVAADDTLQSIAVQNALTWEELCLFNWGTKRSDEINRALVEIVGCNKPTRDGRSFIFTGSDGTRGTGEVLVPAVYRKEGLATGQTHTITVDRARPMPAVSITDLDPWFIPGSEKDGGECCKISYTLEGIKERADKVSLEVHASNYCKATVDGEGKPTYTPIAGPMPVYKQDQPADRCATRTGWSFSIVDWDGKCDVADGMLKPRAGEDRYVNVAFSPYTVMLRFHKSAADKEARLLLLDFWPRWNIEGVLRPASLTLKWEVKGTSKLKHGQVLVMDRSNEVVYRAALKAGQLSEGKHELPWDGKLTDGTFVSRERMPYRFQVQAHTDMFEEQGLALAAMHTEVRLFAHPETGKNLIKEAHKDPNSLVLGLAPFTPKKPEALDEDSWYQYKLAEGGFHPGPVNGAHGAETTRALKEFQRSVTDNQAPPYDRLDPTGAKDAATKAALERMAADARPMFADGGRSDLSREKAAKRLQDKDHASGLVAWVDDRNYYTAASSGRPFLDAKMFLDNYRGPMSLGDAKVDRDSGIIARPWIPLQADLPLLSRGTSLDASSGEVNDASRQAIGPLRVDWTFKEIGEDLSLVDPTSYDTSRIRSRKWVDEATKSREATHQGLKHRNCPDDLGGIRPAAMDSYYKKGIGHGAQKLEPWPALDDAATKSICSLVHDDLGQAAEQLHDTHRGRAGVYAHPSRVAGDGYRYRARVGFEELPAGWSQFPNREVLKRRYPKLPGAHTAKLRLWRKTSYRGYVEWCPAGQGHWPANRDSCTDYYEPAFVQFVNEPGPSPAASHVYDLRTLVAEAEYRTVVTSNVTHADFVGLTIAFKLDYVWPYCDEPHLGIPVGAPGTTLGNFRKRVVDGIIGPTWRRYRQDLLHMLLNKIEEQTGRLRGHFLVEFRASQNVTIEEYRCSDPACNATRAEVTTNCAPADLLAGSACPTGQAGHIMVRHNPPNTVTWSSIPLPAVGCPMGATWLFTSGGGDVWAHELGHHRHLQHAQAYPGVAGSAVAHPLGRSVLVAGVRHRCGAAPGANNDQHDSVLNPALAGVASTDQIHPDKDSCWDRDCIMSYTHGEPLYFCGKCILKNRGWKVEGLANPGGGVHD